MIMKILHDFLPESYTRSIFNEKCQVIFDHIFTTASLGKG